MDIVRHEELLSSKVTDAKVDAVCLAVGLDQTNTCHRLTARRFILGNGGVVDKASQQFLDHQSWRVEIAQKLAAHPAIDHPLFFHRGFDRQGHPLLIWNGPMIKTLGRGPGGATLMAAAVLEEVCRILEEGSHLADHEMTAPEWRLQKFSIIVYCPPGSEPDWRKIREVFNVLQRQYPERLYRALIFPVGRLTPMFWGIAKKFLDPGTEKKIKFLNGGTAPPELLQYVAAEQLPQVFGGMDEHPLPSSYSLDVCHS